MRPPAARRLATAAALGAASGASYSIPFAAAGAALVMALLWLSDRLHLDDEGLSQDPFVWTARVVRANGWQIAKPWLLLLLIPIAGAVGVMLGALIAYFYLVRRHLEGEPAEFRFEGGPTGCTTWIAIVVLTKVVDAAMNGWQWDLDWFGFSLSVPQPADGLWAPVIALLGMLVVALLVDGGDVDTIGRVFRGLARWRVLIVAVAFHIRLMLYIGVGVLPFHALASLLPIDRIEQPEGLAGWLFLWAVTTIAIAIIAPLLVAYALTLGRLTVRIFPPPYAPRVPAPAATPVPPTALPSTSN